MHLNLSPRVFFHFAPVERQLPRLAPNPPPLATPWTQNYRGGYRSVDLMGAASILRLDADGLLCGFASTRPKSVLSLTDLHGVYFSEIVDGVPCRTYIEFTFIEFIRLLFPCLVVTFPCILTSAFPYSAILPCICELQAKSSTAATRVLYLLSLPLLNLPSGLFHVSRKVSAAVSVMLLSEVTDNYTYREAIVAMPRQL